MDHCLSPKISFALRHLGEPVVHHADLGIAKDTLDTDWLTAQGPTRWILLTADGKISRRLMENLAFRKFLWLGYELRIANLKFWPQVEEVIRVWSGLKLHAKKDGERPGLGGRAEDLQIAGQGYRQAPSVSA